MKLILNEKLADYSAFFNAPNFEIENFLLENNYNIILGIDEAGRGCLAGPLSVGGVVFSKKDIISPSTEILDNINDSKKLNEKKRLESKSIIENNSKFFFHSFVSIDIIDKYNINIATEIGIKNILNSMKIKPDVIIIDGNFNFKLDFPYYSIIKGDYKSISIAAASIIAKVIRDEYMKDISDKYPEYKFYKNKGYGTKEHISAIEKYGITKIHRLSYEPVKSKIISKL
jgi:ribonuclease HII